MTRTGTIGFALLASLILTAALAGCTRTWKAGGLEDYQSEGPAVSPADCETCHQQEFNAWHKTKHADSARMAGVTPEELRGCGACHESTLAHSRDPEAGTPSNPSRLGKGAQNAVCGKCHYSQNVLGRHAINPSDKHALLTSAGFEGRHKQLSCLQCHSGHGGRAKMLAGSRAHVCFRCHKAAIVAMGVFQPVNYLTFGKACQACHTIHGGSMASKAVRMSVGVCVVCHFGGVALTGGGD